MSPSARDMPSGTYELPSGVMRASPVRLLMRPVSIAYRLCACVRSLVDAPGKFVALNIAVAGSVEINPKFAVGTSVWLWSQTVASSIVPPKVTLCLSWIQVALSSTTRVPASREDCPEPRPGFVSAKPLPQHAPLKFSRSEEHTSELQSHSFISYAVFCLKTTTYHPRHCSCPQTSPLAQKTTANHEL